MNYKNLLKVFLCSIIGTLIFIQLFSNITVDLNGLQLFIDVSIAQKGTTSVILPPLGTLKAYTHFLPFNISIKVQNINFDFIKYILDKAHSKPELILFVKDKFVSSIYILTIKTIFIGVAGAVLFSLLLRLGKKEILISSLISLIMVIILASTLFLTYDINAFNEPEYLGTLKAAPWAIGILNNGLDQINELSQQLENISDNISLVFSKMDNLEPIDTDDSIVRVLHVSDIHNHPAAFNFIKQVSANFNVDFIIDTGDLTEFGTPLEELIVQDLSSINIKYIFVAGNHDSQDTLEFLKKQDNVIVLENKMININGINIMGFSDPTSLINNIESPDENKISELNKFIQETLDTSDISPDILAVHNPKATENLIGRVPIILNGHVHKPSVKNLKNTAVINAGTTGAAGIRGIQSKVDVPHSAVLLYIKKSENNQPQLIAVDLIKISNIKNGFQVERVFFNNQEENSSD